MKQSAFKPVNSAVKFAELEEEILEFWKKERIFEVSIENRSGEKTWTFLDGPPFITGLPHYGSLLSSIPKDVFPRYFTMKGYQVRRVWGWDCHGLPAENKVENKLGIKRKKDIEESVGVKRFIDECKLYVSEVSGEWQWYIDHIGRWVDLKNAYRTMDKTYMESVMWVFKQMYERGYIYKGLRVSLYCPHCVTPISNFEVAMDAENYKTITERATVYKYKVRGKNETYLLAWSTTPWNKIATPALAVNPDLQYVLVKQKNESYILAKDTTAMLVGDFEVKKQINGKDLIGMEFELHYSFYTVDPGKLSGVVVGASFVTAGEGTGIVTLAAYGEEDLDVMKKENIQIVLHVDEEGRMKPDVPKWGGMHYLKTNPLVNEDLRARGLMYRDDPHTHTVPTCWRCHTRLIYAPQNAWYVDIQKLKPRLRKTNDRVNWFPAHFKTGRYLKSLDAAPDWCISRSRYWGSPVPVWETEDGERIVPGSIRELEELSGQKIEDLHKPGIDAVTIRTKDGKIARRVPEVLDSWIEAGSASFAERHFPFDVSQKLEDFFPPDFISEYTGQIRAWFYVLHVIATALYDSPAFKNVLVSGVILGNDGRKMSKNYGNYPDPKEMLGTYGGDALRLYLLGSPVMHGEDIWISETEYRNEVRGFLLVLWNVYNFFVTYARADGWSPPEKDHPQQQGRNLGNVLDRWILSRLHAAVQEATLSYESYDTPQVVGILKTFLTDDLSAWYVRRIRDRVGPAVAPGQDKDSAFGTLYTVLVAFAKLASPIVPFVTEELYKNLSGELSVHLTDWWENPAALPRELELEEEMKQAQELSSVIHAFRKAHALQVKIPMRSLWYEGPKALSEDILDVVCKETNVYTLRFKKISNAYTLWGSAKTYTAPKNLDHEAGNARQLVRAIQLMRKEQGLDITQKIVLTLPEQYLSLPDTLRDWVVRQSLAETWSWGNALSISTGQSHS